MKIGLDYGGVISFAPDEWAKIIAKAKERGHEIFLISHDYTIKGLKIREKFARRVGITDLSFGGHLDETRIALKKARLCFHHEIELFIDDDLHRAAEVGKLCRSCVVIRVPQSCWLVGLWIVQGL